MSDTFDFMLNYTEPTTAAIDQWVLVEPPKDWAFTWAKYKDMDSDVVVVLYSNGIILS